MALATLSILLGKDLYDSREREFQLVQRDADNLTNIIEKQIQTSTEKIGVVLSEAAHDYAQVVTGVSKRTLLEANQDLLRREGMIPEAQKESLRVIDENGNVIFTGSIALALL